MKRAPCRPVVRVFRVVRVALVAFVFLALASGAVAQDRYFVSTFEDAPDGRIFEIDFGAGTTTLIANGFDRPEDIVVNPATGDIFVCESLFSTVQAYNLGTGITSNIVPTAGMIEGPEGPSISPAGDLYINTRGDPLTVSGVWRLPGADPMNTVENAIPFIGSFGEGSGFGRAGTSDGGLLAVDRAKDMGAGTGKVVLSNPPGAAPVDFITGLTEPFGIDADSAGNIYVAERPLGRISKFDAEGNSLGVFAGGLIGPAFLEVDSQDNVICTDGEQRVLRFDPAGGLTDDVPLGQAIGVAILRQPQGGPCPHSQGFWKTHPASWPVDEVTLGAETYTKAEARALLKTPVRGDASLILAKQLIAAKLNVEAGSDGGPVAMTIDDADDLLATFPGVLPYGVRPGSADGHDMTGFASILDEYNNQVLTPNCRPTSPLRTEEGGGCGAIAIGGSIGAADVLGGWLPWLAVLAALAALRWERRRRPLAWGMRA